jgi:hypothetical protein
MAISFMKEELHAEFRNLLIAFAESLRYVYGGQAERGVWGFWDMPGGQSAHDLDQNEVPYKDLDIARALDDLYEYAVNGRWDVSNNWDDLSTDVAALVRGLQDFPLFEELARGEIETVLCRHTLQLAEARYALDSGEAGFIALEGEVDAAYGVLTLTQVALLANMDEKSVRNAANPKNKNPLVTRSLSGRTLVNVDSARDWLEKRRGFKATEYIDASAERDLSRVGFYSVDDFEKYVAARRKKLYRNAGRLGSTGQQWLDGHASFDVKACTALASELVLDREFIAAAFALHQRLERRQVEEALQQLPD